MQIVVATVAAAVLALLNIAQFLSGRMDAWRKRRHDQTDESMRLTEFWEQRAKELMAEVDRMRERMDDEERHHTAEMAAERIENGALRDRIIELIKGGKKP